jgi:hypothetical protein
MQRIALIGLAGLVAGVAAVPAAASPAAGAAPAATLRIESCTSCRSVAPRQALAGLDLAGLNLAGLNLAGLDVAGLDPAGLDVAGRDLAPPPPATAGSPPLCPARISCSPCGQGDSPCFIKPFDSDTCCTSPGGPCFTCPTGTTIYVESCPCFGDGPRLAAACPARDRDWYCG